MKNSITKPNKRQNGFTMVELMIATSVFSIILLLSLAGFLQIGQLFYKGVNITQTSNTLNQTVTSLKNDILFDTSGAAITIMNSSVTPASEPTVNRYYFCAGVNRYGFFLGRQLDKAVQTDEMENFPVSGWYRFALLKDRLSVTGCPNPFTSSASFTPAGTTELLGDKMRLSNLDIEQLPSPNDKLYTISIKIAYGDDEVLQDPNSTSPSCLAGAAYSQYCFVSDLRTTVRKGLEP
jgi:prepilin-type N-terminal cleavage/methylation domain-containing protein